MAISPVWMYQIRRAEAQTWGLWKTKKIPSISLTRVENWQSYKTLQLTLKLDPNTLSILEGTHMILLVVYDLFISNLREKPKKMSCRTIKRIKTLGAINFQKWPKNAYLFTFEKRYISMYTLKKIWNSQKAPFYMDYHRKNRMQDWLSQVRTKSDDFCKNVPYTCIFGWHLFPKLFGTRFLWRKGHFCIKNEKATWISRLQDG